jgi:hypothetical protein
LLERYTSHAMQRSLSPDEIEALIEYARGKFEEERFPFAPALRSVREVLVKVDPKPAPAPQPPRKPYVPSLVMQRNKRR